MHRSEEKQTAITFNVPRNNEVAVSQNSDNSNNLNETQTQVETFSSFVVEIVIIIFFALSYQLYNRHGLCPEMKPLIRIGSMTITSQEGHFDFAQKIPSSLYQLDLK